MSLSQEPQHSDDGHLMSADGNPTTNDCPKQLQQKPAPGMGLCQGPQVATVASVLADDSHGDVQCLNGRHDGRPLSTQQRRNWVFLYVVIPMALPLLLAWWGSAVLLALAATFSVVPSMFLAQRLYWACPFLVAMWARGPVKRSAGQLGAWLLRCCFEGTHCINVVARLLTLPMRQRLPDFYILGFPKCGTTSLAGHLRSHPAISGLAGAGALLHEAAAKESHFFTGVLGRHTAGVRHAALYRSFFPTVLTEWWVLLVHGVERWLVFDACPTFACLPYAAQRIAALTPHAKLIFMVRDPADGVFSAEIMLRNMGVQLPWTLTQPACAEDVEKGVDSRLQDTEDDEQLWSCMETLGVDDALPGEMPAAFFFRLQSLVRCATYSKRIAPFLERFPADNIMIIHFDEFVADPERTVRAVLRFVGADPQLLLYRPAPARMAGDYRGAVLHPSTRASLDALFAGEAPALERLMALTPGALGWGKSACPCSGAALDPSQHADAVPTGTQGRHTVVVAQC